MRFDAFNGPWLWYTDMSRASAIEIFLHVSARTHFFCFGKASEV